MPLINVLTMYVIVYNNCRRGNFVFLKYLLEDYVGSVEFDCKDVNGKNPLDIACV